LPARPGKFEANKKTLAATQRSFEYSQKRYKIGMLNTIDLITNQNNYFNARNDLLYSSLICVQDESAGIL